ncbi:MAG: fused MFS/spermidine synthase, partial [Deltaproteobacteria bacterium]|nr:fused MFS/spermidine synthase [Deltaproteobacteria bacterium]
MQNPLFITILVALCFFLSGAAGLVLEIVWTKYLNLIFGSTTLSISTTVSAFMGGLALGSYFADRFLKRLKNPVFSYGMFEILIGIYALVIPSVLKWFISVQGVILPHFYENAFVYSLVRFVFCFSVLILPTTAMGATLPILSAFYIRNIREGGSRMGLLYSINTAGATIGTFIAGFFLLSALGVQKTNNIAALTDIFIGTFMVLLSLKYKISQIKENPESADDGSARKPDAEWILIAVSFLSGIVSMCYQMLWTRSISMVIGSSTYAFTIILTTFLLGIALGSFIFSRIVSK